MLTNITVMMSNGLSCSESLLLVGLKTLFKLLPMCFNLIIGLSCHSPAYVSYLDVFSVGWSPSIRLRHLVRVCSVVTRPAQRHRWQQFVPASGQSFRRHSHRSRTGTDDCWMRRLLGVIDQQDGLSHLCEFLTPSDSCFRRLAMCSCVPVVVLPD